MLKLVVREEAFYLCGCAHHKRTGGNLDTRRQETASRDQRISTDTHSVKQDGTDTDKATGLDVASVKRYTVTDSNVFFENSRVQFRADMDDRRILNVGTCSDPDSVNITTQDGAEPNTGVLTDLDIPYNKGTLGDECRFVDGGNNILERFDHSIISQVSV